MSAAALIASSASGLDRAAVADLHGARAFARQISGDAWVFAVQADGSWQLVGRVPLGEAARCLRVRQAREQAGLSATLLSAIQAHEIDGPTAERVLHGLGVAGLTPSITAPTTGA